MTEIIMVVVVFLLHVRALLDLFLSRLRDSGIIFQLNSNLVIVKPTLIRCLKLILCHKYIIL